MEFLQAILQWGEKTPNRAAHRSGQQELTYGDLCQSARKLAGYLLEHYPQEKTPIVVLGHKEPELLIAFLGIALAGRAYAPVDTIIPPERVSDIERDVGSSIILTPARIRELIERSTFVQKEPVLRDESEPYYLMFTSGSTGKPKGVIVSIECLADFISWMTEEQDFGAGEVFLNQAPFSFDLSVMDLYLSLVTGGTLVSVTRDEIGNPPQLFRTLRSSGVTTWVSTPSFAKLCTQEPSFREEMMPQLSRFLFCGEVLPVELAKDLLDRFPKAKVWNTYGPTEATVATSSIEVTRELAARNLPLPIGYSKPRSKIIIMNDSLEPVDGDARGEIVIVGPNVARGYLNQAELSSKVFFLYQGQRAYRTGDSGYREGELFYCLGRKDSQLKLHGYRIEIDDIESNLAKLEVVKEAAVIPKLRNGQPEFLAAFIVRTSPHAGSEFEASRSLKRELGNLLPSYMVPQRVFFLEALPLNPNGKIDRKKLAGMLE